MREETTMSNNPFPGLRAFKQEETRLFFGRDGQSEQLLKRLQDSRFMALVGVSGSGKSSLIRAGLLPKLDGGLMSAVDSDWRVALFRPGNNPIRNMARALVTEAGLGGDSGFEDVEIAIAETTLRRGNLGLLELVRQARRKVRENGQPFLGPNENVLVVVDQFEEIFRIIEQYDELVRVKQLSSGSSDAAGAATMVTDDLESHPREEASAFVKLLIESTKRNKATHDENVYIIVTMRSDYLGDTAQFGGMPEKINEGQYLIPRMDRDERRKAIVGPIAVAGGSITEPLVNQLLNDAGEDPRRLPILQHALMRMWELAERAPQNGGLNLEHYARIEKLSGALSQHANEAFDELSKQHQDLAAKIFKCLTEKGLANREIRRPMKIADISAVVKAKEEDVRVVVDCFRKNGRWFLMPTQYDKPRLTADTLIDISHESLISGWDKLRTWVNEEAESARTYKRLADTAILREMGKEDFYRGPALQVALKWRADNTPNPAWARRYHPEFDKAIAFLDSSLKDTQDKEQAEKDRTARELRRRRAYNIILAILTLVTVTVGILAVGSQRQMLKAQEQVTLQQKQRAESEEGQKITAQAREQEAIRLRNEADDLRVAAEKAEQKVKVSNDELQKSLTTEKAAVAAARKAQADALEKRNIAEHLQQENFEQARNYEYFKEAFDHVAAREYAQAISSLEYALAYFEEKQKAAPSDSERDKNQQNRVTTMLNIADVRRNLGDPEQERLAAEAYQSAFALIAPNDKQLLARTLMKAGSVWKESKEVVKASRAAEYFDKAAYIYRDLGQQRNATEAWVEAGKVQLRFKDTQGLTSASIFFKNAVNTLNGSALASTNADIGESYMKIVEGMAESDDEDEDASPRQASSEKKDNTIQDRLRSDGARYFRDAANAFVSLEDLKNGAAMQKKAAAILTDSEDPTLIEDAAKAFESASALYGRHGDAVEQALVLVEAGDAFFTRRSPAAQAVASRLLGQAAKVDQKNAARQSATLSRIASIYAELDPPQKERALDYYERAIVLARNQGDKDAEVTAILAKADAIEDFEEEDLQPQVDQLYQQAAAVYNGDPRKKIDTLVRVGRAVLGPSRDEAQIAKAEQFFAPALALAEQQPDKAAAASTYMAIGSAYGTSRRAKAIVNYQQALKIYEAEGNVYGQAMALYRLSGPAADQPTNRSIELFTQVLPALETSGKPIERAEAYFALGNLYRRKKEYQTAVDNFNRAVVIYQTIPEQKFRLTNVRNLIRTTQRLMVTP
jgi:conflict system STAND superfamily ATPase